MVIIYLLRHAESAPDLRLAEADWPLSLRGEAQARTLIPVLERLGIERIVSSPYLRAQHSALPFATQVGLEIAIEPDLRERKLVVGLNDNWEELIRRAWADFNFCAPGGESGASCQRRMAACIDRWVVEAASQSASASNLLFCSHGNAIGLYLNLLDPTFGFDNWRVMRNPDLFRLVFQERRMTWDREFTFLGL